MSENIKTEDLNVDEVRIKFWLAPFIGKYGEHLPVQQIAPENHENLSVLEDLSRLGYKGEIIQVEISDEPQENDNAS